MVQRLLRCVCSIAEERNWWKDIAVQGEPVSNIPYDLFCKCHACFMFYMIQIYRFGIGLQSPFI